MSDAEILTFPQRRVLGALMNATVPRTAKSIGTRSDVLWRLQERGYVRSNFADQWSITSRGERAYEAAMEALVGSTRMFADVRIETEQIARGDFG